MVKPIAFYLPQFHPIPENDEWWGPGFTEWTNVRKGRPNFDGHYQPHVPGELGYYDLRDIDVMKKQVALAREYGVHGFCFHYYWFNGRRVLERPLNQLLEHKELDLSFCVCWANENWTRTWDGKEKDILLGQNHTPEDDAAFLKALLPLFADPRYIKVNGAPMLLVYRVDLFPDARATAARWRKLAREAGYPDIHLCAVQFYGINDPRPWGFDAAVEFPPHQMIGPENRPDPIPTFTNPAFDGGVLEYKKLVSQALARPPVDYLRYRGVMPNWDNTARRQNTPHTFMGSTPLDYQHWLSRLVLQTRLWLPPENQFVFVNAWNEWGEGCHLEPDQRFGRQYLEATRAALQVRDVAGKIINDARTGGPTSEAWVELMAMFEAEERSLFALHETVRQKNLRIAALEQRLESTPQGGRQMLRAVVKQQIGRFPVLKTALKRIRSRVQR